jgi:hypothetical protein
MATPIHLLRPSVFFVFFKLAAFAAFFSPSHGLGAELTRPRFDVVLQRTSLGPTDAIVFEILLVNDSPYTFNDTLVHFGLPEYLEVIEEGNCEGPSSQGPYLIGSIGPWSAHREAMCLRLKPPFIEGSVRLHFIFEYHWQTDDGSNATSYLTQERVLNVSFFGEGTIAGVPLNLIAYLIPGVFLIILLRFLDLPKIRELSGLELTVVAVVSSAPILILIPLYFGRAISLERFGWLILLSIAIAALLALPMIYLKAREKQRKSLLIQPTDSLTTILERAFKQCSNRAQGPMRIELTSGDVLIGSMTAKTPDGYVLLGWFELKPETKEQGMRLNELEKQDKFHQLIAVAASWKLQIEPVEHIQKQQPDGSLDDDSEMRWIQGSEIKAGPTAQDPSDFPSVDLTRKPLTIEEG